MLSNIPEDIPLCSYAVFGLAQNWKNPSLRGYSKSRCSLPHLSLLKICFYRPGHPDFFCMTIALVPELIELCDEKSATKLIWYAYRIDFHKNRWFHKNFKELTGKHLHQRLFFNKVCNFIKKETLLWIFAKLLRTTPLQNTAGQLLTRVH